MRKHNNTKNRQTISRNTQKGNKSKNASYKRLNGSNSEHKLKKLK